MTPYAFYSIHDGCVSAGSNSSNFTATNQLFLANPTIAYWRFEVVYSLSSGSSSSALNFVINQPPSNGSCSISPLVGTTSTVFTVTCVNWQDADGVKDYSIYSGPDRTMVAFSSAATMSLRLPAGRTNTSMLQLVVVIRDQLGCVVEVNLSSVVVTVDSVAIDQLLQAVRSSSASALNNNPLVQILSSGNQNAVAQVLLGLSQQFNGISTQALQMAVNSECECVNGVIHNRASSFLDGVPLSSVAVSLLGGDAQPSVSEAEFQDEQLMLPFSRRHLSMHPHSLPSRNS